MADLAPRQVRRQHLTLRLLLRCACRVVRLRCFHLAGQTLEILFDRLFQQASLLSGEGLAAGGELQPLEYRHLVGKLVDGGLLISHLADQALGQRAQLLGVEVVNDGGIDHGPYGASAAPPEPFGLTAIAQTCLLQQTYYPARFGTVREHLPRQSKYQRIKLRPGERQGSTGRCSRPNETPLMQSAYGQPQTESVVHKNLESVGAAVREQIRVVRLGGTKDGDHSGKCAFRPEPQVDRFDREPDRIDTDHPSQPRSQSAHPDAADTGQRTCTAVPPRRRLISMQPDPAAVAGGPGSWSFTGMKLAPPRSAGRACRRHLCTRLALIPWASATAATEAPGASHLTNTSRLNSALWRRLPLFRASMVSTCRSWWTPCLPPYAPFAR